MLTHDTWKTIDRDADVAADSEARLTAQREQLADDLFDAYMSDNYTVIDEVDSRIQVDTDTVDNLLKKLRDNFTSNGMAMRSAYMKIVADVCETIANGYDNVDQAFRDYEL